MPARGRSAKIDKNVLIDVLINYKDRLIRDGQKVVSKCDAIWITIAKELKNQLTPLSLYTFVTCNRYNVREKLTGPSPSLLISQWMIMWNIVFQMYRALFLEMSPR